MFEPPIDAPLAVWLLKREPCGEADDPVDLEACGLLIAAHGRVGLDAEDAVGRDVKRALDLRHERALTADLERQAALADLDRAVGGRLGGHGGAHARARHLGGRQRRGRSCDHGRRQCGGHVLLSAVLAPYLRQERATAP